MTRSTITIDDAVMTAGGGSIPGVGSYHVNASGAVLRLDRAALESPWQALRLLHEVEQTSAKLHQSLGTERQRPSPDLHGRPAS